MKAEGKPSNLRRLTRGMLRVLPMLVLVMALVLAVAVGPASAQGDRLLFAVLTGANEVPGPGDPDGIGIAVVSLHPTAGQVCFGIVVVRIVLPAIGAHIHVGGPDVAGPVVVPLTNPDENGLSQGCVSADRNLIQAIQADPAGYYVNVHTTDFPAGAVRGQLFRQ